MRKVEILKREPIKDELGTIIRYDVVPTGEFGAFHQFGINFHEFESGPGHFTIAIVEMTDGRVIGIPADSIKFTDPTNLGKSRGG